MGGAKRDIPPLFIAQMAAVDSGLAAALAEALSCTEPVVSVRHNCRKGRVPAANADKVPWCPGGEYLDRRPAFIFDPAMHQGLYYVQDASSMFLWYAVKQLAGDAPVDYLDACAAPGGKTTAAIDALVDGSRVVAHEFVPARAAVLRENLFKWGYPYVAVTTGDTSRFRDEKGRFDIIAADVPCSGEGMMRKDAVAVEQWAPALVTQCAARQREILSNLWPALRPGGYMIYSTCTFNLDENEHMVKHLVDEYGAEPVSIDVPSEWGIAGALAGNAPVYRFMPHNLRGEGLFMAVLRKPAGDNGCRRVPKRAKPARPACLPDVCREVGKWLDPSYAPVLECDGDTVYAVPGGYDASDRLRARVPVAVVKGKSVIPAHELAMSLMLRRGVFPEAEVEKNVALQYLRRESVALPGCVPRGIALLTFGGMPLGFVKNLGSRANNMYPSSWRILSHMPES